MNNSKLKAVIFDWAGTTVDFGCMAPTGVFIEVFRQKGIEISISEARGPMGMHKRDHIATIASYPRVASLWLETHGKACGQEDISEMFNNFIPLQMSVIKSHADIIPGVLEAVEEIRLRGLKIGSSTGYNNEMMDILVAEAARSGYKPDAVVCATDVPAGRPAPWMAFKNAELLGVYPMKNILKVGDTIADIEEGLNAGMWSAGVVVSGNEMGLTQDELNLLTTMQLELKKEEIREKFYQAGAHFVIDTMDQIPWLLDEVEKRLQAGLKP